MSRPEPFPWDEAIGFALGRLLWPPDQFWRASPRELAWAVEGRLGRRLLDAAGCDDLRRLMQAFPDGGSP